MLKLIIAFAVFAAISLFVIFKAGDKADLSGEKHGDMTSHGASAPAAAAPASAAASAPASAASQ
ncbi:MAG TPA: hypothetical protein VFR90_16880 [Methylibium sp.]|uniref:hypothetical protein n=1 Tax=Methylibium sp. TaxID=2067992 RepID=UPI002DBBDCAA|nr:hypothetical protein [Methylibium sp.]HEU4460797.1 hypothetical protein [Methylibium sp.]